MARLGRSGVTLYRSFSVFVVVLLFGALLPSLALAATLKSPSSFVVVSDNMVDRLTWKSSATRVEARRLRYVIERASGGSDNWKFLATTRAGVTSYIVKVAVPGPFRYRVVALGRGALRSAPRSPPTPVRANSVVSMSARVGPAGATLRSSNGEVAVAFPAGTFDALTSVTVADSADLRIAGTIAMSRSFDISASGTPLRLGADITMRYHAPMAHPQIVETLVKGIDLASTHDLASLATTQDASVDLSAGTFTAHVSHFTYFEGVSAKPHGTTPVKTNYCVGVCHNLAVPGDTSTIIPNRDKQICYYCHGAALSSQAPSGAPGPNIRAAMWDSTDQTFDASKSRHPVANGAMYCTICHNPHRDPANGFPSLLRTPDPYGRPVESRDGTTPGAEFCWACHGARNNPTANRAVPGYYLRSGGDRKTYFLGTAHADAMTGTASGIPCLSCHNTHGSPFTSLIATNAAGIAVTGNNSTLCYGCHGSASAGYPAYSRTASGYPAAGSWPGTFTYTTAYNPVAHTGSFHTTATASWPTSLGVGETGGACANCHDPHGSPAPYDLLLTTSAQGKLGTYAYSPSNFSFCFNCHDTSGPSRYDIAGYFPVRNGGESQAARGGGHMTTTPGVLPAGSALPCYYCHNPHGSKAAYGLTIVTRSNGATLVLGDSSGEITMTPARTSIDIRRFCLTCHSTSTSGLGWNGTTTQAVIASDMVAGISRLATGAGVLRLPSAKGHRDTDPQSCYDCHGGSYKTTTSNNVHNPSGGASMGGERCYSCHTSVKETMDAAGTATTLAYHHVMGTSTTQYTGDIAPDTGAYPTSTSDLFCVSCHTDHSYFNGNPGSNLRSDIANPSGAATGNSDYLPTAPYGVCISCHTTTRVRDNVRQKPSSTNVAKVVGGTAVGGYGLSAHQYKVVTRFGSSPFLSDCGKCHTDEGTTQFQNPFSFTTHVSGNKVLSQFGETAPTGITRLDKTMWAAATSDTASTWTWDSNSRGQSDSLAAESNTPPFEMWQSFVFPDPMETITTATLTVRSRATGGWGQFIPSMDMTSSFKADGVAAGTDFTLLGPTWLEALSVNEPDDDVDYGLGSSSDTLRATLQDFDVPGVIRSVTVYALARNEGPAKNLTLGQSNGATVVYAPSEDTTDSYDTYEFTRSLAPDGTTWDQTDLNNLQVWVTSDASAQNLRVTQIYARVAYAGGNYTADDQWGIQYSLNSGSTWANIQAATTSNEAGYTDHTVDLASILTTQNAGGLRVRIYGKVNGGPDPFGTVDWDSTRLDLGYSYNQTEINPSVMCFKCHARQGQVPGGKPVAGRDFYGSDGATMSLKSETILTQYGLESRHPVNATPGGSVECANCHNTHAVQTGSSVVDPENTYNVMPFGTKLEKVAFCFRCHSGGILPQYAVNDSTYIPFTVQISPADAPDMNKAGYAATSHWVAHGSLSASETQSCNDCHDNHGSTAPKLLGLYDPVSGISQIGSQTITGNDKSVCDGCHAGSSTGYGADVANASMDASGYPLDGTWPGAAVWDAARSGVRHTGAAHADGAVVWPGAGQNGGTCNNCHDVHGTASPYDALLGDGSTVTLSPSKFTFCFTCHDGSNPSARNMANWYPVKAGGTATSRMSGHRTIGAGNLPKDSAIPCYDCHNPHGSASSYGLTVVAQSNGVTFTIGDDDGELNMDPTTRSSADIRHFCFSCHTAADNAAGWDGSAMTTVTGVAKIEGIDRTTYVPGGRVLRLPAVADGHFSTNSKACYECHGADYSTPNSPNVHNPGGSTSSGGRTCYDCHTVYQYYMEDDQGAKIGVDRNRAYHHVMGGPTYDGDIAPGTGLYPTSKTNLACVSCHTDHNYFNNNKASNLRRLPTNTDGGQIANRDYWRQRTSYGTCVNCHNVSFPADKSNQAPGADATMPVISGSSFAGALHNYQVTTNFSDGTTFYANCVKCHDDELPTTYESLALGPHRSWERGLLAALEVNTSTAGSSDEAACFKCHNGGNTPGKDGYGVANMRGETRVIEQVFTTKTSKHPLGATATGKVECTNCHNVHYSSRTGRNVDPDNTYTTMRIRDATTQSLYCLKCHDGNPPKRTVSQTTYVPHDVKMTRPQDNKNTWLSHSHSKVYGSIQSSTVKWCRSCHDNHVSNVEKLLGSYDATTDANYINGVAILANDNTVCGACHTPAGLGYTAANPPSLAQINTVESYRDGPGFFSPTPIAGSRTTVRWPGMATYNLANSAHQMSIKQYNGRPLADCKSCHDVHGTANTYDELRNTYTDSNFALCFDDCHNEVGVADSNIRQYYPATVGGSGATTNIYGGHRIITAGTGGKLAVGEPIPCYDCHNPHGSTNGNSNLISDQRWAGVGDTKTDAAASREFCLGCHITNDYYDGEGRVLTASDTQNLFEGMPRRPVTVGRRSKLLLSTRTPHTRASTTGCFLCHGADYSDAEALNVHNPSPGTSRGGTGCYRCHTSYRSMDAADTTDGPTTYHHVLGTSTVAFTGDRAPSSSVYPTSTQDVFCVSCHADHNYFNGAAAGNLRTDIANPSGAATSNTDYLTSGSYGICVSCHTTQRTKNTTGQHDDGMTTVTPVISGAQFVGAGHQYNAPSTFTGSTFNSNCSKCHDDDMSEFQTSANKFGTHEVPDRRLLTAFGAAPTDPAAQNHCFGCHTGNTAGNDFYGSHAMSATLRSTQTQFGLTGSTHPVTTTFSGSVECVNCHNVHTISLTTKTVDPDNTNLRLPTASATDKVTFCLRCHDGSAPAYRSSATTFVPYAVTMLSAGMDKSTYTARGHWIATGSISAGETKTCFDCHDKHASGAPKLLGVYDQASGTSRINGVVVTAADKTACYACHGSASTSFPAAVGGSRDASGYPQNGTWPGPVTWNVPFDSATHLGAAHATGTVLLPASGEVPGSCGNCHDVHGAINQLDELRGTYRQNNFSQCFACHDGSQPDAADIDLLYPASAGGRSVGDRAGHETVSAGNLPAGSALPCYDCHNPHGSAVTYGLQVTVQTAVGTTITVGDAAGELNMNPASRTAADVRKFCFSCHTTSDSTEGWNGSAYAVVAAGARVEGIDRTVQMPKGSTSGAHLRLPAVNGHRVADAGNCYTCHEDPHEPGPGGSEGGQECYTCHAYGDAMDAAGTAKASAYHHVMGTSTAGYTGGIAPSGSPYPTSTSDLFCVSCHTDHNYFNSYSGANLRQDIANPNGAVATNTDFMPSGSYGVCISCHSVSRSKDTTNQKSDGSTSTPVIGGAKFDLSAHQYPVTADFGGPQFRADCSKCHNDEQTKRFQTGTKRFGTHWSADRRLLSAFGAAVADPLAQQSCFGCHKSGAFPGRDAYDATPMNAKSTAVAAAFTLSGSSHPVTSTANGSVECANCHNPHGTSATTPTADPDNTYAGMAYSSDVNATRDFCLRCHDGSTPGYRVSGPTLVPATVTIAASDAARMNKSAYSARGHWAATGSIGAAERQSCAACHDKHGSNAPKLLGVYQPASGLSTIGARTITANDKTVCYGCHTGASTSYPAAVPGSRDASGYPQNGAWPGASVWDVEYDAASHNGAVHATGTVVWPYGSSEIAGSCNNCHDVHGASNGRDELVATFTTTAYDLCFTCHDGSVTAAANIRSHFPVSAGGTSNDARAGHKTISTGTLPAGSAVPCYDCHNPHGSASPYGLLVVVATSVGNTVTIGDGAGEIDLSTDPGVRRFCFTCHTTSDTTAGWDGSGYVVVSGVTYDGISRTTQMPVGSKSGAHLRLPVVNGHTQGDSLSCLECHGSPHQPTGGVSDGGSRCYNCHTTYRQQDISDPNRTDNYHHVLGSAIASGDMTFVAGSYPTLPTEVYCLSCHVDHDVFGGSSVTSPAANLRTNAGVGSIVATSTDYATVAPYGLCTSCHSLSRAKDATNQKSDGSAATPKITGGSATGGYGNSAHAYSAVSTFGTSAFRANCSKCHNDDQAKKFQTGQGFGTHVSTERHLLTAFGVAISDPLEQADCFGCHEGNAPGNDEYGMRAMTQSARSVATQFALSGSSHPVTATANGSVDCVNCHNAHVVSATTVTVDPDNTYNLISYATTDTRNAYCLKCHDGTPPAYQVDGATYVPSAVGIAASEAVRMEKDTYTARSHMAQYGSIGATEKVGCATCHDQHASNAPKLLGVYQVATGQSTIRGQVITANDKTVCYVCHTSASTSFPATQAASRDASGYPQDGTWPGAPTWNVPFNRASGTGSFHATGTVVRSGEQAGSCNNCHDVHGGANAYDEVVATYTPAAFGLCFTCHDGSTTGANIKSRYPVAAGGLSASPRGGHRTISAGKLPAKSALPCYECHNPHGSASQSGLLIVVSVSSNATAAAIGDQAGEISLASDAGVRRFCFSCHVTSNSNTAWNGSVYTSIPVGVTFEGISRTVQPPVGGTSGPHLRLPNVNGHKYADTASCTKCHGSPHDPTGGLSDGGQNCYGCHTAYVGMDMADPARAGTHHHVLGTSPVTYTGDQAPMTGSYPTSTTAVFCVSCHTDHNYFNGSSATSPAANLRGNIAVTAGSNATNTDYVGSAAPYGICVSCHTTSLAKDNANQLSDGLGSTVKITGGAAAGAYGGSAHNYTAASTFGSSQFRANCSKCHNDEQTKLFQSGPNAFGTHLSSSAALLRALGVFTQDPPKNQSCLKCHTTTGDLYGGAMSAAAKVVATEFAYTSKHRIDKVACANCHNVHAASAAGPVADPDNTYNTASLSTTAAINTYCLKCHDGTLPSQTVNGATLIPYTVSANATANISAFYSTSGHGKTDLGAPYTNRTNAFNASSYNDVTADWANDANVLGAPDAATADSAADNAFELRNAFTFPAGITTISDATITVRSRALGGWGGTNTTDILYTTSAVANGSWIEGVAGADADTFLYNEIDDPAPASSHDVDATYIHGAGTTAYSAGTTTPSVPVGATNISVSIVWTVRENASVAQNVNSRLRVNGTSYSAAIHDPDTTYTTYTDTWATNPAGGAWTVATVNTVNGLGVVQSGGTATRVTQMHIQVSYREPNRNDDTWAIQYTTDGSTWSDIDPASATSETVLTDHTLDLGGILTAANYSNFGVRIIGATVGSADNSGTVSWDASTLQLLYSGNDYPGPVRADCRDCHEHHGSPLPSLIATQIAGESVSAADQHVCFACHDANGPAGDIERYYPTVFGGTNVSSTRSGHRTKTAGVLPAGSALTCDICHDPHGTATGAMIKLVTQSQGVTVTLGDSANEIMMSSAEQAVPVNVRNFCFACHSTSDTGKGWNGASLVALNAGDRVLGILRTDNTGGKVLRLPAYVGHREADTSWSCYLCHGDDFALPTSVNVHNPGSGESRGGISCYTCHTVYQNFMEDGSLAPTTGPANTDMYHHVLGSATQNGDTVTYPTSANGKAVVYCLSCHVDHNLFSPLVSGSYKRGNNLRDTIGASAPGAANATNTDFNPTNGGVCLSCHTVSAVKDTANERTGGSSKTPTISVTEYDLSAHDYSAPSTFSGDASSFRANCAKCHDDEYTNGGMENGSKTAGFQSAPNRFSVHYSSENRILAAMGATATANAQTEENHCLACHGNGNPNKNTLDYYGVRSMDSTSASMTALFSMPRRHDVASSTMAARHRSDEDSTNLGVANRHVECEDCHNPHAAQAGVHTTGTDEAGPTLYGVSGVRPSWVATNWGNTTGYTPVRVAGAAGDYEAYVCLKCHSSNVAASVSATRLAGIASPSGGYIQTNVALDFNPNNWSGHNVMGAVFGKALVKGAYTWAAPTKASLGLIGTWDVTSTMTCTDCHSNSTAGARGPHGSTVQFVLRYGTAGTDWYDVRDSDWANAANFCNKCHNDPHGSWMSSRSSHRTYCRACHVRIPHGWKRPRLLGNALVDPLPYMNQENTNGLLGYSGTVTTTNQLTGSGCRTNCGQHNGTPPATAW